jgi:hypothetical protein
MGLSARGGVRVAIAGRDWGGIYVSRGVCEARRWAAAHGRPRWANGGSDVIGGRQY